MRAVNLLPADLRRGGRGGGGTAAYVLLGILAVALVLASAYALAGRSVAEKRNELVRVTARADAAEARAGRLAPYKTFAELRDRRVETVTALSRSRFNWPYALREVSRVMPANVWLTQIIGTVAPGISVEDGASAATTPLRAALQVPALELTGCSVAQDDIARYLAQLRLVSGVTRVSIASSEKTETGSGAGAPASGPGAGADCRQGSTRVPRFELVVFFERSTAAPSQAVPGATPAQTSAQGSAAPADGSAK